MNQVITATFENGVLKPEQPLDLPAQARVRLIVQPIDWSPEKAQEAWEELERLCEELSVDSGGVHLTRDQLHQRR